MIKQIIILLLFFTYALSTSKNVYLKYKKSNSKVEVYMINNNLYDIAFRYDANTTNLLSIDTLPIQSTIKAKSKKLINTFFPIGKKYTMNNNFSYIVGNPRARHDNNYLYKLPFKTNTSHIVSQGFNGKFSHKGNSLYAIDFHMKIGTKIYLSREGIIVAIKQNSNKGGANKKYLKDANFILVKHSDGTYAKYVHLKYNGVKVKVGQSLKRGDFLGYSGNTGYTSGPHLHFIVFKAKNYKSRTSIKIKFISKNKILYNPIKGKSYISVE